MSTESDHQLLEHIKSGDRDAFMALYNKYWEDLYTMARSRTQDRETARELLQNLWLRLLEKPEFIQISRSGSAKPYLRRYLHYRIIDHYQLAPTVHHTDVPETAAPYEISDTEYFEILEQNDIDRLLKMINEVVGTFSATSQQVFDLRVRQGLSVEETAKKLGISKKTVSNLLSSTIADIRRTLGPEYETSKKMAVLLVLLELMAERG